MRTGRLTGALPAARRRATDNGVKGHVGQDRPPRSRAAVLLLVLTKLTAHLAREKITPVGGAIRRILRTENVTFQTTTTWKPSHDPDFVTKMNRVLDLYDQPPADGRVICYDEFGPLNLNAASGQSVAARRPTGTATGISDAGRSRSESSAVGTASPHSASALCSRCPSPRSSGWPT